MVGRGVSQSQNDEWLHGNEGPRGSFDRECDVNVSPSRSTCWIAKGYEQASRLAIGQEDQWLGPLPAKMDV